MTKNHGALTKRSIAGLLFAFSSSLVACGGGGSESINPPPPPPPPTIQVTDLALTAADVTNGSTETGSASANVRFNETDSEIEITVLLANIDAESVSLRNGYAGSVGPELFALVPGTAVNEWVLPASPLLATDIDALEAGALYMIVNSTSLPDGALRGQIQPTGIEVARFGLSANQVTVNSLSTASGTAWLTLDNNNSLATLNVVTANLDDASAAELRQAAAGDIGPVVFDLIQDPMASFRWQLPTSNISSDTVAAASAGELYVTISTAAVLDGVIRGQLLLDDLELVVTDLTSAALVMSNSASKSAVPIGRAMTTIKSDRMGSNVNLFSLASADNVELRRAPAGQNGPLIASYDQDIDNPNLWLLRDYPIDIGITTGLDNQTLYIRVTSPAAPSGAARGQLETVNSQRPPDISPFVVVRVDPPNAATVTALPATVVATLNRLPLVASVTPQAVLIEASGGDGSFGDGNEVTITPSAVTANGADVEINLGGVVVDNDVYRIMLMGSGDLGIVDQSGIPLDGDGDGEPGGSFESAFELDAPEVSARLSTIQANIFTPTCATSGCHTGSGAPDGLDLSSGSTFSNTVNVTSVQNSSLLRIDAGDPDNSYLVRKIEGSGIVASRMPLGRDPLTQEEIDLIRLWVSDGAQDN